MQSFALTHTHTHIVVVVVQKISAKFAYRSTCYESRVECIVIIE